MRRHSPQPSGGPDVAGKSVRTPPTAISCEGCGAVFRPRRPSQRFCRPACRPPILPFLGRDPARLVPVLPRPTEPLLALRLPHRPPATCPHTEAFAPRTRTSRSSQIGRPWHTVPRRHDVRTTVASIALGVVRATAVRLHTLKGEGLRVKDRLKSRLPVERTLLGAELAVSHHVNVGLIAHSRFLAMRCPPCHEVSTVP